MALHRPSTGIQPTVLQPMVAAVQLLLNMETLSIEATALRLLLTAIRPTVVMAHLLRDMETLSIEATALLRQTMEILGTTVDKFQVF
jgi:hypothetical protein